MVKQYPHTISITQAGTGTQDSNGNITVGSSTSISAVCRAEPASGERMITGPNGTVTSYDWMVYLPVISNEVIPGASAVVMNGSTQLHSGPVKRFFKGQLSCKIWL